MTAQPIDVVAGKLTLPPYGYVHSIWDWDVATRRVPEGFRIKGAGATPRQWRDVVEALVDELAEFLWPRFDRKGSGWVGGSVALAMKLSLADLELMSGLRKKLLEPANVGDRNLSRTHRGLFVDEDFRTPVMFPTLDTYLEPVAVDTLVRVKTEMEKSFKALGPAPLRFKEHFQRPRPYQLAFMLNRPFEQEWAKSSLSPSLVSGHCMQGIVGTTGAYMATRLDLEVLVGAVASVQQFAVDFGDRRVFAGVHYPSDNIASWFCALRFCDHLYGEAGQVAKDFMRTAMKSSAVFNALLAAVAADEKSPFAVPMQKLAAEADRPATRSDC